MAFPSKQQRFEAGGQLLKHKQGFPWRSFFFFFSLGDLSVRGVGWGQSCAVPQLPVPQPWDLLVHDCPPSQSLISWGVRLYWLTKAPPSWVCYLCPPAPWRGGAGDEILTWLSGLLYRIVI